MNDSHSVGGIQHTHDRFEELVCLCRSHRTARFHFLAERVPFHMLHHHVNGAVARSSEVVNGDGIRVTKASSCLTFAAKTAQPLCVCPDLGRKDLDCYPIPKEDVASAINSAHSSFAEHGFDLILPIQDCTDY